MARRHGHRLGVVATRLSEDRRVSTGAAGFEAMLADLVRQAVREAVEPLRLEVERLRGDRATLVPFPEAARRLGVSLRAVQKWAKDGRLEVVPVGGLRMIRLPDGTRDG